MYMQVLIIRYKECVTEGKTNWTITQLRHAIAPGGRSFFNQDCTKNARSSLYRSVWDPLSQLTNSGIRGEIPRQHFMLLVAPIFWWLNKNGESLSVKNRIFICQLDNIMYCISCNRIIQWYLCKHITNLI